MSKKYERFADAQQLNTVINKSVKTNGNDVKYSVKINGNAIESPSSSVPSPSTSKSSTTQSPIEISSVEAAVLPNEEQYLDTRQEKVRRFVENLYFRLFGLLLIIIDCIILIIDLSLPDLPQYQQLIFDIVSLIFITYFVVEVSLRIYAKNVATFFSQWWDTLDFSIIFVSFIVNVIYFFFELSGFTRVVILGRLVRVVRMTIFLRLLYTEPRNVQKSMRNVISENKRRFRTSLFDLDLTYITDRVIAMSFPSSGKMAIYRNHIRDVSSFLDLRHGPNNYKVYNLCAEKDYDANWFHGRVVRVAIDDHNVPSLQQMQEFVEDADQWLKESDEHIIVIHCKGGKGRTGTMISAWLIYSGHFSSSTTALTHFGERRTDTSVGNKFQGVETPSQSRFVEYFSRVISGQRPQKKVLTLKNFKIHSIFGIGSGNGTDLTCTVYINRMDVFQMDFGSEMNCRVEYNPIADILHIEPVNCPVFVGDVRMKFNCRTKSVPRAYEDCAWYFWFNTDFINDNQLILRREDLDNPHKPKTWKLYREYFGIQLNFVESNN